MKGKKKKKTRLRCSMEVKIVNQPRQRHPATRWAKSQIDISDLDIVNKTVEGSAGNWREKKNNLTRNPVYPLHSPHADCKGMSEGGRHSDFLIETSHIFLQHPTRDS